jgi:hypothetical protein
MINGIYQSRVFINPNIGKQSTNKTQSASFAAVQNNNDTPISLDSSALVSSALRLPGGGMMSASVFKSVNFSVDNPVMLVRGTDGDGKAFEVEVNINNVNPNNASFVEMFALDGYFAANGQSSGITRAAAGAMSGAVGRNTAFTQFDFVSPLKEFLETQRFHNNWDGVMRLSPVIDNLLAFMSKRDA